MFWFSGFLFSDGFYYRISPVFRIQSAVFHSGFPQGVEKMCKSLSDLLAGARIKVGLVPSACQVFVISRNCNHRGIIAAKLYRRNVKFYLFVFAKLGDPAAQMRICGNSSRHNKGCGTGLFKRCGGLFYYRLNYRIGI